METVPTPPSLLPREKVTRAVQDLRAWSAGSGGMGGGGAVQGHRDERTTDLMAVAVLGSGPDQQPRAGLSGRRGSAGATNSETGRIGFATMLLGWVD